MSASAIWVRLGGSLPATEVAPHTPPTWETLADGGTGEISLEFSLSVKAQHHLLKAGVLVEVMVGPQPVAAGLMSEPDRTTWEIKAQGLQSASGRVLALDSGSAPTLDVAVAINTAVTFGWWPVTFSSLTGTVATDSDAPMYLGALLDAFAIQEGKRWGVDGERGVYLRADPTEPSLFIAPDVAAFGVTDEGQATQLIGQYFSSPGVAVNVFRPAPAPLPAMQEIVDLTAEGFRTSGQVTAVLDGMLARGKNQTRWTNGVEVSREQITVGGVPAFLPTLSAGVMARATGIPTTFVQSTPWLDVVIGKTRYTAGDDSIYLEPINTAPRTLPDVIAAA